MVLYFRQKLVLDRYKLLLIPSKPFLLFFNFTDFNLKIVDELLNHWLYLMNIFMIFDYQYLDFFTWFNNLITTCFVFPIIIWCFMHPFLISLLHICCHWFQITINIANDFPLTILKFLFEFLQCALISNYAFDLLFIILIGSTLKFNGVSFSALFVMVDQAAAGTISFG